MSFAHIGGMPIEETLAAGGPALLTALAAAVTQLHARLRRRRPDVGVPRRKMDRLPDVRLRRRAYGHETANPQSLEE